MTQNSIGVSIPVPLSQGGTAAITAPAALASLGAVPLAGGTMTGQLILNADPVTALGAVTKQYADAISSGLDFKDACYAASTVDVNATYANGAAGVGATLTNAGAMAAFAIDGVSPPLGSRILIKDQAAQEENGIYTLTTVGSGAVNWVLTRATDFDTPGEIPQGAWTIINNGTVNETSSWVQTAVVATIGTDPITFSQFTAGVGANTSLSNLITTSINQDLLPDTDVGRLLGSDSKRWAGLVTESVVTGIGLGQTLNIQAWDTVPGSFTNFIQLTVGNPATCAFNGEITSVTQALGTADTRLATTEFVQDAVDDLPNVYATRQLDNLAAVAINTSLISDTDLADDLGSTTIRWDNVFAETLSAGHSVGHVLNFSARDVDGASTVDFITATSGNTPTCAIAGAVTGITQAPGTNTAQLATTAFVAAATGGGSGANVALSNLAGVAINTSLISDTDVTDNLGSQAIRWNNIYAATLQTGDTAADTLQIGAWDVDNTVFVPFFTLTAANTPTAVLASAVTATTQAANDNSTKLATTAYADAQAAARANVALSNLSGVAINTTLVSDTDITDDLGTQAIRWRNIYAQTLQTGDTNADTLTLGAWDVDGASLKAFITMTAANSPTCAITDATITGGSVSSLATDIAVADGGTGASSFTAYAVVCGGTTSTNPLQSIASVGSSGNVLTSNGAGALPTFQAAAGGSGALVYIAQAVASSSSTIDFSNNLSSTYDEYVIKYSNLSPGTNNVTWQCRVGTGAGPTYQTANYAGCHAIFVLTTASCGASGTGAIDMTTASNLPTTANVFGSGTLNISNVNNATNWKTIYGSNATQSSFNTAFEGGYTAAQWRVATVLTSFRFLMSSGNIATGTFRLYGVVNS